VQTRLTPDFNSIDVSYPPKKMLLVAVKDAKLLEVWVSADGTNFRQLKTYSILGQSGTLGPKLKEGDRQVPEGIYKIESLNPNSLYHLALRVNYPNDYDRLKAKEDGRENLGSDIMIHGKRSSIGCLAMGDPASEELFVMAAQTGIENVSVILSPVDFRNHDLPPNMPLIPSWSNELYAMIKTELIKLKKSDR
jgi:murein L,D-transpeptidase YafK